MAAEEAEDLAAAVRGNDDTLGLLVISAREKP